MRYIFEEGNDTGTLAIKYFHPAWYDKYDHCFDEDHITPEKFNFHDLMYVPCDDEPKRDGNGDYCRVFIDTIDGRQYELKFERVR